MDYEGYMGPSKGVIRPTLGPFKVAGILWTWALQLPGTAGILWDWALQGYGAVGHSGITCSCALQDTLRLCTARVLCG